jgi:tRNA A-37 threonylcarbamoyl transferase component Bud32
MADPTPDPTPEPAAEPTRQRTADPALDPGALVGGYRIERKLGAGAAGAVYAAIEPTIHKRVAVKVLHRACAEDDAAVARFEREARVVNDIGHPGIVDVFAFGRLADGRPYLVMSLLEGRSLRAEIEARGPMPQDETWAIARQVAEGLAAAHEAGVVHRDLKPDNVFVCRGSKGWPRAVVMDFGLAKLAPGVADAPGRLTATGGLIGTPAYMSPEQWWNEQVDARTDQYAFGAMLFEMLVGSPPFAEQSLAALVQAHLHQEPPSLAEVGRPMPVEVESLVRRALAKSPQDRFGSMRDLVEAADRAFAMGDSRAPTVPAGQPLSARSGALDGVADAHAATVPAPEPVGTGPWPAAAGPKTALGAAARDRSWPVAWPWMHAAILAGGLGAVVTMGYAGQARRDVANWVHIAGYSWMPSVAAFAFASVVIGLAALPRWEARLRALRWWLAVAPAAFGAFGTYTGWHAVMRAVGRVAAQDKYPLLSLGMYEANASRFVGFALSCVLCCSLAALPQLEGRGGSRGGGEEAGRGAQGARNAAAIAVGLVLLAAASGLVRAASGAFVALVGAFVVGVASRPGPSNVSPRAFVGRACAAALGVVLAVAVGFARLEAREAALWNEQPTRADRVAEILAADGERTATSVLAIAAAAAVALALGLRAWPWRASIRGVRPSRGTFALAAALGLVAMVDAVAHHRFQRERERWREPLAAQFALFARLDPPRGDVLEPQRFPAHAATALQMSRDTIAIDGRGIARLGALESREAAIAITADLNHALGRLDRPAPEGLDLSVSIDREVPYELVARVLRIARGCGVRRAEVLLTRGRPPVIPVRAPAEASHVLASDFVAIPVELVDRGERAEARVPFATVAEHWIRLARDEGSVRVEAAAETAAPSR